MEPVGRAATSGVAAGFGSLDGEGRLESWENRQVLCPACGAFGGDDPLERECSHHDAVNLDLARSSILDVELIEPVQGQDDVESVTDASAPDLWRHHAEVPSNVDRVTSSRRNADALVAAVFEPQVDVLGHHASTLQGRAAQAYDHERHLELDQGGEELPFTLGEREGIARATT
jgi:hypothetical protein